MLREILDDPRLVRFLVANVIVSAITALVVMSVWSYFTFRDAPALPAGTGAVALSTAATSPAGQLQITTVVGAGDLQNERVTIQHVGDADVSLAGWRLRDENGIEFRFPALVLHPGAQVAVYTRPGDDTATELYWDREVSVWSPGERVSLVDAGGSLQATYTVP